VDVLVFADLEQQIYVLGEELVVVLEVEPEQRERPMNEPRPTTVSTRPRDSRSSVAKLWKRRTESIAHVRTF